MTLSSEEHRVIAKLDLAEAKLEQASKIIEQMKAEIDALRKRKS